MRIRKLLLIHPKRSARALIKKYIYAELCDTEITEAESGQIALTKVETNQFDVVISSERLKDMELENFASRLEAIHSGAVDGMIVIADSEAVKMREDLLKRGFKHIVQIRLKPADLIKQINVVCNPRKWRKDARYHIPNATVAISSPNRKIEAAMINISMGGVLVEFTTDDPGILLSGGLSLSLQIPLPGTGEQSDGICTKLLRVETVAWTADHIPRTMRASFIFVDLNPSLKGKLEEWIQMAKEEKFTTNGIMDWSQV